MLLLPLTAVLLSTPTVTAPSESGPAEPARVEPLIAPAFAPLARVQTDEARNRTYLRVTGGLITSEESDGPNEDIEFDEGYLISVGFGSRFGASESGIGFGLELDGIWTDQDTEEDAGLQAVEDISVIGVLLDGIVDFRLGDQLSIYAGAGIGAAWMDVGTESDALNDFDEEDGPFLAWQAKAGIAWRLGGDTALHFGYRFLNIDDVEIDDDLGGASFDLETQQHALEAGLVFGF